MKWTTEIKTIGELSDAVSKIKTKEEADEFMKLYTAETPIDICKDNIGYVAAYFDKETAERIWKLFDCKHPMFGREMPSTEQAFKMGQEWGKKNQAK